MIIRCTCKTGRNNTMIGSLEDGIFIIKVKGLEYKLVANQVYCPKCGEVHTIGGAK